MDCSYKEDKSSLEDLTLAQSQLFRNLGSLGLLEAEHFVKEALVSGIGDADQEREEEEGQDGFPDVHLVGAGDHQDDQQPDVGKQGEGGGDAEDNKVLNTKIFQF